jgi:hypothetical protein
MKAIPAGTTRALLTELHDSSRVIPAAEAAMIET